MALTGPKNIRRREPEFRALPVKANARIHQGALVVGDDGEAAPGFSAAGLVTLGIAEHEADNSGGDGGGITVTVRSGCFRLENDTTAPVTFASVGRTVFVVDDETVAATDGGGTRSPAGICFDVEDDFVWVRVG